MKLLIDENPPVHLVELAASHGLDVVWVQDELPGVPDTDILQRLQQTGETLATRDIRFANHILDRMAKGLQLGGVILIREQSMANLRQAWLAWLANPRQPRGIAVLTTLNLRYREFPENE